MNPATKGTKQNLIFLGGRGDFGWLGAVGGDEMWIPPWRGSETVLAHDVWRIYPDGQMPSTTLCRFESLEGMPKKPSFFSFLFSRYESRLFRPALPNDFLKMVQITKMSPPSLVAR